MTSGAATVRVVGRYALYQPIASGGMATIFLGRLLGPVGFARTVAVKRLHPQYASDPGFVGMFVEEARLAARIQHPNVVSTLDVVATGGEVFLVLEYVHGESLAKLIRVAAERAQPIPVPVVVSILSGVLQGLEAAHAATSERGVPLQMVHRDVSPQNILLGLDGQARILDFGVARAVGRVQSTANGQVKGKLGYMPPEQVRGEPLGPTTDVYAAAIVLWEALASRRLFTSTQGDGGLVLRLIEGTTQSPSDALRESGEADRAQATAPLDAVVMRGLARAKDERWQSAREFARALEAAVVPATAAQVSDWLEQAAGPTLRERAALVAQVESTTALDLTPSALDRALADAVPPDLSGPPDSDAAPTELNPPQEPKESHAPGTTPMTDPAPGAAASSHSPSHSPSHAPPHTPPPDARKPRLLSSLGPTLASVASPVATKPLEATPDPGGPTFAQTLQSGQSPLAGLPPTPLPATPVPESQPARGAPSTGASPAPRAGGLRVVLAVVALALAAVVVAVSARRSAGPPGPLAPSASGASDRVNDLDPSSEVPTTLTLVPGGPRDPGRPTIAPPVAPTLHTGTRPHAPSRPSPPPLSPAP